MRRERRVRRGGRVAEGRVEEEVGDGTVERGGQRHPGTYIYIYTYMYIYINTYAHI